MSVERSLDIFCHCLPTRFCVAANKLLRKPLVMFERAQQMPVMVDVEARLKMMDEFPGYQQILSLASPTIESIASCEHSPELARIGNDSLCEMVQSHPDRFPYWIASLPMNAPDAAKLEMDRAIEIMGAVGVQVYTNVNGTPLDEPENLAILEYAAKKHYPIWLHPIRPITVSDYDCEDVSKFDLWWAFGWPYETGLAMGRLVFSGFFDRWPEQIVITHHCGGIVPMMEGRISSGMELLGTRNPPRYQAAIQTDLVEKPIDAFRRFHADTASFGSRATIECATSFFGLDRLMFATDSPFDPEQGPGYIRETLRAIGEMDLSKEEHNKILFENACRILKLEDPDVQG